MPTTRVDLLDEVLEILDGLATPGDRARLTGLRQRTSARRLRVLVAGEAKRGKSTLINRLLGRDVLPTGVAPVTAIVTSVHRAEDDEHIEVSFHDGSRVRHDLGELAGFVTERGNPRNERSVHAVEVLLRSELLDRFDVELVDTPGTGSVFEHNTAVAEDALQTLDAAIFVVTADPPISAAECALLVRTSALSVHTVVVLNKADQINEAELAEAEAFTAQVIADATDGHIQLFSCAARQGRTDPGYARFADTIERYFGERAAADVVTALRGHATRLAAVMLDATALTERSLQLSASSSADRVALFRDRIEAIKTRHRDLDDRCWATERSLRRQLDESAFQSISTVADICRQEAVAALDGGLAELAPAVVESEGRALVVRTIRERAERWRTERARVLEAGLASIIDMAAADLDAQLADVRAAARDLLDIQLAARARSQLLRPTDRFWYDFDPGVGWELPLSNVARKALPGKAKRARAHVLDEISELVDRQIGRARAELQQRLRDSVRAVVGDLRRQYDDTLGRVSLALDDATAISATATEERQRSRCDLAARAAMLSSVLARLEEPAR